jgi:chemotaxis protein CheY-P-specific phosphatase CheC
MFKLTPIQNDALREAVNIGTGQAATSVHELTGQAVMIGVPLVGISTAARLKRALVRSDNPLVCFLTGFGGDLNGIALWLLPRDAADALARESWVQMRAHQHGAPYSMGLVHKEIAFALTSGYLEAINSFLGLTAVSSSPVVMAGKPDEVMDNVIAGYIKQPEQMGYIAIDFEFTGAGQRQRGLFLILPDTASLAAMLGKMGLPEGCDQP